jgi:hypothetical protein
VAYLAFVLAIAAMPIANAVAIYFTMPFFVAGLAGPLLGERVRQQKLRTRWSQRAARCVRHVRHPCVYRALFPAHLQQHHAAPSAAGAARRWAPLAEQLDCKWLRSACAAR